MLCANIWKAYAGGLWSQQPYFLLKSIAVEYNHFLSQFQYVLTLTPLISIISCPSNQRALFTFHYWSCHLIRKMLHPDLQSGYKILALLEKAGPQQFSIEQCQCNNLASNNVIILDTLRVNQLLCK